MFRALTAVSPRVDWSASDIFSDRSPGSELGDRGLPPLSGDITGGQRGAVLGAAGMIGDTTADIDNAMEESYFDESPTPPPPSSPANRSHIHHHGYPGYDYSFLPPPAPYSPFFPSTAADPPADYYRGADTALIAHPGLYAQFLPTAPPASPADDPPALTSGVHKAHTALRGAISQPYFPNSCNGLSAPTDLLSQSHDNTPHVHYGRHHPYARSPLPRSASSASLRYVSQSSPSSTAASALFMPYPEQGRSVSTLSSTSFPSLTSGYPSQVASLSATGSSEDGFAPSGETYANATAMSRFFDDTGVMMTEKQIMTDGSGRAISGPVFGVPHSGQVEGVGHLFMSGLGLDLGDEVGLEGEAGGVSKARMDDQAVWGAIKGRGLCGDEDQSDSERDVSDDENLQELEAPDKEPSYRYCSSLHNTTASPQAEPPGASPAYSSSPFFVSAKAGDTYDDADAKSDSDTPLSRHRDDNIDIPQSSEVSATVRGAEAGIGAELGKVKSQPPVKRVKVRARRGRSWTRTRVQSPEVGVEVVTLPEVLKGLVEKPREKALRSGLEFGLEVEVDDEEAASGTTAILPSYKGSEGNVSSINPITSLTPSSAYPRGKSKNKNRNKLNLSLHPSTYTSARARDYTSSPESLRPSATSTLVNEHPSLAETPEAEYHPSGRPKRAAIRTRGLLDNISIKAESESTSGGSGDGGDWEADAADWVDQEVRSETGTPMRDIKLSYRARGGGEGRRVKHEGTYDGKGGVLYLGKGKKRRVDPEALMKVESLRGRCVDEKKRTGNFDEKLCQLLVDPRFAGLIGWNAHGDKIVIRDFEAFWEAAGPYVMCARTKRSAFDKQLSNHGFKRESTFCEVTQTVCKTLTHPNLAAGDVELWAKLRARGQLTKWGKGIKSGTKASRVDLRHVLAERDETIVALTAQLQAMTLDRDRGLEAFARMFPGAWTAENIMAIFGLDAADIPDSLSLPPFTLSPPVKLSTFHPPDLSSSEPGITPPLVETGAKRVLRKRSRQGVMVALPTTVEVAEAVIEAEAEGGADGAWGMAGGIGEDGKVGKGARKIGRKRSKMGLTAVGK